MRTGYYERGQREGLSKRSLLPRPFHGRKMARRALNRMIAITCTSHCVVSRRWHSFYLCVKRACCSLRSAGLYLQNVLPPFYPHAPHKARRSRANRPAASNDAPRVLSMVVLTVLFAECVFSLFFLGASQHFKNKQSLCYLTKWNIFVNWERIDSRLK